MSLAKTPFAPQNAQDQIVVLIIRRSGSGRYEAFSQITSRGDSPQGSQRLSVLHCSSRVRSLSSPIIAVVQTAQSRSRNYGTTTA